MIDGIISRYSLPKLVIGTVTIGVLFIFLWIATWSVVFSHPNIDKNMPKATQTYVW